MRTVAAFTDTYLPTVNGVSYTVETWRRRWERRGGRMSVVYPDGGDGAREPADREYPVPSVAFPFYPDFRFGVPSVPDDVAASSPDVVHAHTPFTLGLAARRLASERDLPLVASFHTPATEYAGYVSETLSGVIRRLAERYERWFYGRADAVVAPTVSAAERVDAGGSPVHVVSNGVDTEHFRPADPEAVAAFRERHDLPDGPLVGYTGRHGHEKRLEDLLAATAPLDVGVAIAGDGPAREDLERRAAAREGVRFLGFLDREAVPTFYSALDVFAFPSPVETQGLVALESMACGTPVVAVDAGALRETVSEGETGYRYPRGDVGAFRAAIRRALADRDDLSARCLEHREELCVERSIDALRGVYDQVA